MLGLGWDVGGRIGSRCHSDVMDRCQRWYRSRPSAPWCDYDSYSVSYFSNPTYNRIKGTKSLGRVYTFEPVSNELAEDERNISSVPKDAYGQNGRVTVWRWNGKFFPVWLPCPRFNGRNRHIKIRQFLKRFTGSAGYLPGIEVMIFARTFMMWTLILFRLPMKEKPGLLFSVWWRGNTLYIGRQRSRCAIPIVYRHYTSG